MTAVIVESWTLTATLNFSPQSQKSTNLSSTTFTKMFKEITSYCVANGNPFNCYEDAEKAYLKHKERVALREFTPSYKSYHKLVKEYFRKIRKHRFYCLYDYDVKEVFDFLKSHHYYGTQIFDCHGTSDDYKELVYSKDGVEVWYCGSWDYLEIFGLRDCDFYVLKQAHDRVMAKIFDRIS